MNKMDRLERISRMGLRTTRLDAIIGGRPEYNQMDFAHMLSGLSKEASAWALYAYANSEDELSLSFLTTRLAKIIRRKYPELPAKSIIGLVRITLKEALMYRPGDTVRKGLKVTLKSKIMGISRKTYYKHLIAINEATYTLLNIINAFETQIDLNISKKS